MGCVRVQDLGKAFKHYPTRWARLAEWLLPWRGPRHELVWALRDVSFEVRPGRPLAWLVPMAQARAPCSS